MGLNSVIPVSLLNEETSDLFLSLFPEVLSVLRFPFSLMHHYGRSELRAHVEGTRSTRSCVLTAEGGVAGVEITEHLGVCMGI